MRILSRIIFCCIIFHGPLDLTADELLQEKSQILKTDDAIDNPDSLRSFHESGDLFRVLQLYPIRLLRHHRHNIYSLHLLHELLHGRPLLLHFQARPQQDQKDPIL